MVVNNVVNNIIFNGSDKNDEMRGHTLAPSATNFCSVLCSSSNKSEELYTDQMQRESNSMVQNEPTVSTDSIQLEYAIQEVQNPIISKTANILLNMRTVYGHNIAPTRVNSTTVNNYDIINVQLNYDINRPLDPDSWDNKFKAISLHSSIEHLGSDIKNIKESLSRMEKYILSKSIDGNKANNIKDFEGLDKTAWGFITALYSSQWDSLIVDGTNQSFRNNIKSKFSLQTAMGATKSKASNVSHSLYISTLLPSIPVKSAKEVNEISKYFKK